MSPTKADGWKRHEFAECQYDLWRGGVVRGLVALQRGWRRSPERWLIEWDDEHGIQQGAGIVDGTRIQAQAEVERELRLKTNRELEEENARLHKELVEATDRAVRAEGALGQRRSAVFDVRTHNDDFRFAAMVHLYDAARKLYRAYTKKDRPAVVAALYSSTREALRAFKRHVV